MNLDKKLIDKLVDITSSASIACHKYIGKKDKVIADKAATDTMRKNLNKLDIDGKVVIGEGELDEAPMLYIGEKLGTGKGPSIDIAVDPLEGTNFAAKNLPGALSVICITSKGNLFNAPETYMEKLAVGKDVPKDATNLDFSIEKNIKNIAESKNKDISKITACILDRPRHKEIINKLKDLKVNLKLLSDGDISGALLVTNEKYKVEYSISNESLTHDKDSINGNCVYSPIEGKFVLTKGSNDRPVKVNDVVTKGDVLCYIESMKVMNAIKSEFSGKILKIYFRDGEDVYDDDILFIIKK